MNLFLSAISIVSGYLLGSIPVGLLIVRWTRGTDIRQIGSGRTGGTNVLRAAGWKIALLSGAIDVLMGVIAVIVARWLGRSPLVLALTGGAAVVGHNYSIFLRFRGGAGTSTSIGGAIALWPWSGIIALVTLLGVALTTRRASLGSIAVALALPILYAIRADLGLEPWAYVVYGGLTCILTLWALRANIKRLLTGTERVLTLGKSI